jgi:hypothetical protein
VLPAPASPGLVGEGRGEHAEQPALARLGIVDRGERAVGQREVERPPLHERELRLAPQARDDDPRAGLHGVAVDEAIPGVDERDDVLPRVAPVARALAVGAITGAVGEPLHQVDAVEAEVEPPCGVVPALRIGSGRGLVLREHDRRRADRGGALGPVVVHGEPGGAGDPEVGVVRVVVVREVLAGEGDQVVDDDGLGPVERVARTGQVVVGHGRGQELVAGVDVAVGLDLDPALGAHEPEEGGSPVTDRLALGGRGHDDLTRRRVVDPVHQVQEGQVERRAGLGGFAVAVGGLHAVGLVGGRGGWRRVGPGLRVAQQRPVRLAGEAVLHDGDVGGPERQARAGEVGGAEPVDGEGMARRGAGRRGRPTDEGEDECGRGRSQHDEHHQRARGGTGPPVPPGALEPVARGRHQLLPSTNAILARAGDPRHSPPGHRRGRAVQPVRRRWRAAEPRRRKSRRGRASSTSMTTACRAAEQMKVTICRMPQCAA